MADAANLSQKITTGTTLLGASPPPGLERGGYVAHEYVASGTGTSYAAIGLLTRDGRWRFEPDGHAPYRTRVVVRRPADGARFSRTVVAEWLNVSDGIDANPEYFSVDEELTRAGHVWVGVSAQFIGVERSR